MMTDDDDDDDDDIVWDGVVWSLLTDSDTDTVVDDGTILESRNSRTVRTVVWMCSYCYSDLKLGIQGHFRHRSTNTI